MPAASPKRALNIQDGKNVPNMFNDGQCISWARVHDPCRGFPIAPALEMSRPSIACPIRMPNDQLRMLIFRLARALILRLTRACSYA